MKQIHGYIVFDVSTRQAFVDLVVETLETSEFITTEWYDMGGHPDDVLLVQEHTDEEVTEDGR